MRLLLVKMSSLGDLVHCFPALTDAARAQPNLDIDWVVERSYAELAALHPAVGRVIPIELRAWRRRPWRSLGPARAFVTVLRQARYDVVLDAQGLLKSAIVARVARGRVRAGFDRASAREGPASVLYRQRHAVPRGLHAVQRLRRLFGAALGYAPQGEPDFGLPVGAGAEPGPLVFLHGTTWPTKQWPVPFWRELAAAAAGYSVVVPWGDATERGRAEEIAAGLAHCVVPPRQPLGGMIRLLQSAAGVVTVDTGLGHLAAALGVPSVGLYGPTDPKLTGLAGHRAANLCATLDCAPCRDRRCRYRGGALHRDGRPVQPPCFAALPPERVWAALQRLMHGRHEAAPAGTLRPC